MNVVANYSKLHVYMLQEKISILRDNETLAKENDQLNTEKDTLLRNKELADAQIVALMKSLEAVRKELKDRDALVFVTHYALISDP